FSAFSRAAKAEWLCLLQRRRMIGFIWKDAYRREEAVDEFDASTVMPQIDPDTGHIDGGDIDETRPRIEGHGRPTVPAGPGRIDDLRFRNTRPICPSAGRGRRRSRFCWPAG